MGRFILKRKDIRTIALILFLSTSLAADAMDHFVPSGVSLVGPTYNGGLRPGDTITLSAGLRGPIRFVDIKGTLANPIIIRNDPNASEPVIIDGRGGFVALRCDSCEYVRLDGSAHKGLTYGIKVTNNSTTKQTVLVGFFMKLSRFVTVRHIEVDGRMNSFAGGIWIGDHTIKTIDHPGYWREGHRIEHTYIHDMLSEGMYLGPNHGEGEPPLRNIDVGYNIVENSGWDCIQLKSTFAGVNRIHHNTVKRCGIRDIDKPDQHLGISIYHGGGEIYNNYVESIGDQGISHWLVPEFEAESQNYDLSVKIYNNVVVDPGRDGIARGFYGITAGPYSSAQIYNNTVIRSPKIGINVSAERGFVMDNLIVDTGAGGTPIQTATGVQVINNRIGSMDVMRFVDPVSRNFRLTELSPARNAGSASGFPEFDFDNVARPQESASDQGAFEFSNLTGVTPAPVIAPAPEPAPEPVPEWKNTPFLLQTGIFQAEFDVVPISMPVDAVIGLSSGSANAYSDLAAIVRFSDQGTIDVRNGGSYSALKSLRYDIGQTYHVRMLINLPARSYDVLVKPAAFTEVLLADDFAFRTEQALLGQLNNLGSYASSGSHSASDLKISPIAFPAPGPSPAPIPAPVDSTEPSVSITSPSDGDEVARKSTLGVSATANDSSGSIAKAGIYVKGTLAPQIVRVKGGLNRHPTTEGCRPQQQSFC